MDWIQIALIGFMVISWAFFVVQMRRFIKARDTSNYIYQLVPDSRIDAMEKRIDELYKIIAEDLMKR
jgi:hypothetical protein